MTTRLLPELSWSGQRLRERFKRARAEGALPKTVKPDALAAFVMTRA